MKNILSKTLPEYIRSRFGGLSRKQSFRDSTVHWAFEQQEFGSAVSARSAEFRAWINPSLAREKKEYSFAEEFKRAILRIDQAREGRTVALCYSGGAKSELVALGLRNAGIPFEPYFLDIWGLNTAQFLEWSRPAHPILGKKPKIISLDRAFFYEIHSLRLFEEFGCIQPTYLAMTYLFSRVPKTEFILVADGDLERTGQLDRKIWESHTGRTNEVRAIPFSYGSIFYHLWAHREGRKGEFYFFRSTPGLLLAQLDLAIARPEFPLCEARDFIYESFPEIARRPKSTNWEGSQENKWIRYWLESNVKKEAARYWIPAIGGLVDISHLAARPGPP